MKRLCRRGLTLLMAAVMLFCAAVSGSAVRAPRPLGDADGDYALTVMDATRVQRWLAGFSRMNALDGFLADVNGNGRVDIIDATLIQRKLAGLSGFYDDGTGDGYFGYTIEDYRFYADYNSGKARVGAPVTFHAEALAVDSSLYGNPQDPMTYAFYVNDRLVQPRSEANELVYTFTAAGSYRIRVEMFNAFDMTRSATIAPYEVVEPYALDRPVIVSTLFKEDTHNCTGYSPLTLRCEGGEGPYRYMVTSVGRYDGYEKDGFFTEELIDENTPPVISTGYTVGEVYRLPRGLYSLKSPIPEDPAEAVITVYAKDSKGNISEPVTVVHRVEGRMG